MKKESLYAGGVLLTLASVLYLTSRRSIPKGASAVKPFDRAKYLGNWYEVARLDFRFEKNLNNATAHYSLNDDGSIRVVNRGFNYKNNTWKESIGKARFVASPQEARLKVSFFGPFYAGYNVIAIDPDYRYALVAGESLDYLWLLSREKTMPDDIKQAYLEKAQALGYKTDELVWTQQD